MAEPDLDSRLNSLDTLGAEILEAACIGNASGAWDQARERQREIDRLQSRRPGYFAADLQRLEKFRDNAYASAEEQARQVIDINPNKDAYLFLLRVLEAQKKYGDAFDHAEQARHLYPEDVGISSAYERVVTNFAYDRIKQAAENARENPNSLSALHALRGVILKLQHISMDVFYRAQTIAKQYHDAA